MGFLSGRRTPVVAALVLAAGLLAAGAASAAPTSTTTLTASSKSVVTNQPVALVADVAPESGTPMGTVAFNDNGTTIAGCANVELSPLGPAYIATCMTSFAADSSPAKPTATFVPSLGSAVGGSTSANVSISVGLDSTTTTLKGPSIPATAKTGITPSVDVKFTASVTPAHQGAVVPSGTIEMLESGSPAVACRAKIEAATATCAFRFPAAGSYSVSARYAGDGDFAESTSPAKTVLVNAAPAVLPRPAFGASETAFAVAGNVFVRGSAHEPFAPLTVSTISLGDEIEAANGRASITTANAKGTEQTALVFGGRFSVRQEADGSAVFVPVQPLTGCGHRLGTRTRHLGVRTKQGVWGTAGRFATARAAVTTANAEVEWLAVDYCKRSTVTAFYGKVAVHDLAHHRTRTLGGGASYVAVAKK